MKQLRRAVPPCPCLGSCFVAVIFCFLLRTVVIVYLRNVVGSMLSSSCWLPELTPFAPLSMQIALGTIVSNCFWTIVSGRVDVACRDTDVSPNRYVMAIF